MCVVTLPLTIIVHMEHIYSTVTYRPLLKHKHMKNAGTYKDAIQDGYKTGLFTFSVYPPSYGDFCHVDMYATKCDSHTHLCKL